MRPATIAIVAFDGLIADTLPLRARAVAEAISAEYPLTTVEDVICTVGGRSISEAVDAALVGCHEATGDDTMRDLIVLRAQRACSTAISQGVPLCRNTREWVRQQSAAGQRLVFRADSSRRDVDQLLQLSGLEQSAMFVRCSDDLPRCVGDSSVERSYAAIDARLHAHFLSREGRLALERSSLAARAASRHIGDTRHVFTLEQTRDSVAGGVTG